MGSDAPFELIQGELISVSPSSTRSNHVLSYLHYVLYAFVDPHRLGQVYTGEAGFTLEVDPDTVVAPDVAFVSRDRIPDPFPERGFAEIIPNLIVEVVSPSDEPADIKRKQAVYDRVGVPLVWWIDPIAQTAVIHVFGKQPRKLERTGALDGGAVLPGFSVSLETVLSKF
jgi:Uma2 family endonuclease